MNALVELVKYRLVKWVAYREGNINNQLGWEAINYLGVATWLVAAQSKIQMSADSKIARQTVKKAHDKNHISNSTFTQTNKKEVRNK